MAKHFREDVERTQISPRQRAAANRRARDMRESIARTSRAQPVRRDAYYDDYYDEYLEEELPVRGGIAAFGRGLFMVLAWVVRIVALGLFVLVMLNSMPIPPIKYHVAYATELLTSYLPWGEWGTLAVDTPFGGTFRCDLCLASLGCFFVDWVLCRIRAALV